MTPDDAQIPREQLPIPLFNGAVLAVRAADGAIYLVVADLCAVLQLNLSSHLRAIRADARLRLAPFRLRIGHQVRTQECLLLDDIPLWLLKVRPSRGNAHAAERLRYVQTYLIASVRSAFAALTGLPDAPSRQIEDMQDLDCIDRALRALDDLAARQAQLEASQERARRLARPGSANLRGTRRATAG